MYTILGLNRRGYVDERGQPIPLLRTKVTSVMIGSTVDTLLGNFFSVVAHRGDENSGHFICYSKVDNSDVFYINSDSRKAYQSETHPYQSRHIFETVDFMIYKT